MEGISERSESIQMRLKYLAVTALALLFILTHIPSASAQSSPGFSFDNFAGTYYLDRNGQGVAKLTSQEDMVVTFTGNSPGIMRDLPITYQGHNLNLKIISITDALGNPIQYKTSSSGGNEAIQIGDPAIQLSGVQTYRVKYQTAGVASFFPDHDEFLIDVNGRGWDTSFGSVKAFVHLAPAFSASLINKPSCYIGYQNQSSPACTVKTEPSAGGQLVTANTNGKLGPYQALVLRMDFKKGTFKQVKHTTPSWIWLAIAAAGMAMTGLWFLGTFWGKPSET